MKKCPKCGFENQQTSADCPRCGIIYEKFQAMHEKQDDFEDDALEEEEDENKQEQDDFEEEKEPFEFDKDRILEAAGDFFREYYLHVIIGGVAVLVIVIVLFMFTGGIKGKTGIVSWTKVLGEQGDSDLLFDNIELLRKPEIPDVDSPDLEATIICDMEKNSMVKVLKIIKDGFLKIEVLNGKCKGEIGYIPIDNFELME